MMSAALEPRAALGPACDRSSALRAPSPARGEGRSRSGVAGGLYNAPRRASRSVRACACRFGRFERTARSPRARWPRRDRPIRPRGTCPSACASSRVPPRPIANAPSCTSRTARRPRRAGRATARCRRRSGSRTSSAARAGRGRFCETRSSSAATIGRMSGPSCSPAMGLATTLRTASAAASQSTSPSVRKRVDERGQGVFMHPTHLQVRTSGEVEFAIAVARGEVGDRARRSRRIGCRTSAAGARSGRPPPPSAAGCRGTSLFAAQSFMTCPHHVGEDRGIRVPAARP